MVRKLFSVFSALVLLISFSNSANATLISRLGGQAYYDTESDLTWIANANAAAGTAFDDGPSNTDGKMTWANANAWADSLSLGGFTDWRLPTLTPINGSAFNPTFSKDGSSDVSYNISRPSTVYADSLASEMAYLFYNSLGNVSAFDVSGVFDGSCTTTCLSNAAPFVNIQVPGRYWTNLEFSSTTVWAFDFNNGLQSASSLKQNDFSALAVRNGDVAPVPVPAAIWLMGSAIIGLTGFRKKKA